MERVDEQMPKTNYKRIVIGLILIALAGLIFADNFNYFHFNWEDYFWQILLIVIGLICLAKKRSVTTGIILIAIGGYFFADKALGLEFHFHHLFWPIILAVIGILMIVKPKNHHLFSGREK